MKRILFLALLSILLFKEVRFFFFVFFFQVLIFASLNNKNVQSLPQIFSYGSVCTITDSCYRICVVSANLCSCRCCHSTIDDTVVSVVKKHISLKRDKFHGTSFLSSLLKSDASFYVALSIPASKLFGYRVKIFQFVWFVPCKRRNKQ